MKFAAENMALLSFAAGAAAAAAAAMLAVLLTIVPADLSLPQMSGLAYCKYTTTLSRRADQ